MVSTPKIYTIIVNYKSWQDTVECIESLLKIKYANNQIIVIDNASPNNAFEALINWASDYWTHEPDAFAIIPAEYQESSVPPTHTFPNAKLLLYRSSINGGFAAGNNIGIRFALYRNDFDFLWLLNNDTVADKDSLPELVKAAILAISTGRKIGMWGSKLLYYQEPSKVQAIGGKLNLATLTTSHIAEGWEDNSTALPQAIDPDYIVGASMFISKDFIDEVGLMDETYFLYFEELDWAQRGKRRGFGLGYVPLSRVFHKEGKTIGSSSSGAGKSDLADFHGLRSKIIFFRKFYPERTVQLYASLLTSACLRLARLQFKRGAAVFQLMWRTKNI
nr:glycosyltransferase family 2 protein [Rufibacter immobilis]